MKSALVILVAYSHDPSPSLAGDEADLSVILYKNRHHKRIGHNCRHLLNILACEQQKAGFIAFWHTAGSPSTQIPNANDFSDKIFVGNLFVFIFWTFMILV